MLPVVVLALALMVVAIATAGVAALQLRRAALGLVAGVKGTMDRAQPLIDDLQEGAAVASTEVAALQQSVERLQRAQADRKRGRR